MWFVCVRHGFELSFLSWFVAVGLVMLAFLRSPRGLSVLLESDVFVLFMRVLMGVLHC